MMVEIREKRGWSYGAYGAVTHRKNLSSFTMWIAPGADQSTDAATLLMKLFEDFQANGVTAEELDFSRKSILNSAAFYTDTPSKRLNYEVRKKQTGFDPVSLLPHVESATLEEVNQAASIAYDPQNLFGVVVGTAGSEVPVGEAPEEGEREVKSLVDALRDLFGEDSVAVKKYDAE
jgi:zinc protease